MGLTAGVAGWWGPGTQPEDQPSPLSLWACPSAPDVSLSGVSASGPHPPRAPGQGHQLRPGLGFQGGPGLGPLQARAARLLADSPPSLVEPLVRIFQLQDTDRGSLLALVHQLHQEGKFKEVSVTSMGSDPAPWLGRPGGHPGSRLRLSVCGSVG